MNRRRAFKLIHFAGTAWFIICAAYLMIVALLNAGKKWWLIISLTSYSVLAVFLLISLYLFAIYRGIARSQKIQLEHIITTSVYYSFFYDTCPFLGALAGFVAAIGYKNLNDYLLVTAAGTLWTTFLVWIIIDPAAGCIEMLLPSSRRHRQNRLAETSLARERASQARQSLLNQAIADERLERERWAKALKPYAHKLRALIANERCNEFLREQVVDIGVIAWQMGGLGCMRLLHQMVEELEKQVNGSSNSIDHISLWWHGIGNWRPGRPEEIMR